MIEQLEQGSAITVEVPATTANLGPGFDCLGMALDLMARFTFEPADALVIDGCEQRFRGPDNLVWTTMLTTFAALGHERVTCHITIDSPIPLSGGLGSSATCVVAGVLGAMAVCGMDVDRDLACRIATQVEGHPDNVVPAILGGLVSSFVDDGRVWSCRYDVADNLRFIAIAPPYEVRTSDARRVMPTSVDTQTVVWQTSHCVATVRALVDGDCELLGVAAQDRLHEPVRKVLIADYEAVRTACMDAGASAYLISGSGSTMLAICDGDEVAARVSDAVSAIRPAFWLKTLRADGTGARLA